MHIRQLILEAQTEESLVQMLRQAGENVTSGDVEAVDKSSDTTSFDVYISGEPYQFDVDKSGQVYFYDHNKAVELGFIDNIAQLVINYKKLKGV